MKTKSRRKSYAWERGLVASSIPAGERTRICGGCQQPFQAKELRYGYCKACWVK